MHYLHRLVELLGFEPKLAEPKSTVLPLHYSSENSMQNYIKDYQLSIL